MVADENYDFYVIEVSSFQLDGMFDFKADIAILLNITPDHLDRYGNDFELYKKSKFRLIRNMGPEDHFVCAGISVVAMAPGAVMEGVVPAVAGKGVVGEVTIEDFRSRATNGVFDDRSFGNCKVANASPDIR